MEHTNKEFIIKNPEIERSKKDNLTLKELTEDALYNMAFSISYQLENLRENKVSKKLTVMNSDQNKAVIAKLEIYEFSDVQKSGEQIYSLIEGNKKKQKNNKKNNELTRT